MGLWHLHRPQILILARDRAAEVGKPFPVIDDLSLKEKDWPKDFYVFPGGLSAPTVVYMPLFNRRNCRGLCLATTVCLGSRDTPLVVVEGEPLVCIVVVSLYRLNACYCMQTYLLADMFTRWLTWLLRRMGGFSYIKLSCNLQVGILAITSHLKIFLFLCFSDITSTSPPGCAD